MSVPGAFGMNADQLWKCARVLRAMAPLAQNVEQSAELEARADRAEGLAWDKALRHRVSRGDLLARTFQRKHRQHLAGCFHVGKNPIHSLQLCLVGFSAHFGDRILYQDHMIVMLNTAPDRG
jgi:hypothetical protein